MTPSPGSDVLPDRADATTIDATAAATTTVNTSDKPKLGFDQPVPAGGYRWWYVDAISDDGAHALTLIAFIGSVFSPYYARARAKGTTTRARAGSAATRARAGSEAPAEDHCTVNLALYHPPARWCMTERGRHSLRTSPTSIQIGASGLQVRRIEQGRAPGRQPEHESGYELVIDVDEISTPLPRRLQGRLIVTLPSHEFPPVFLDAQQQHVWQPIAPRTRIKVEMKNPALSWQGDAYVDGNRGSVSLESSFRSWEWSRCHPDGGGTAIQYDVIDNDGRHEEQTFRFDEPTGTQSASGQLNHLQQLPPTRWFRIPRAMRTDGTVPVTDLRTLEDTPFYSRSQFRTSMLGQPCKGMHESLLLKRFDNPITRLLLSFRMPRRAARWLGGPGAEPAAAHANHSTDSIHRTEEPREGSRHE